VFSGLAEHSQYSQSTLLDILARYGQSVDAAGDDERNHEPL
jgi:hypothetical protein